MPFNNKLAGNLKIIKTSIRLFSCPGGPIGVLKSRISNGELKEDEHQLSVAEKLNTLYTEVNKHGRTPMRKRPRIKGLYIYGTVGSGKTMLMDLFYDCVEITRKNKVHFNEFMVDVHARIHKAKLKQSILGYKNDKPFDPIKPVAKGLSKEALLICLDEFQVTDIADAVIVRRLFTQLFRYRVVMVATSNRAPDDLYKDGLPRNYFTPFITVLRKYCEIFPLRSHIDYKQRKIVKNSKYFVIGETDAKKILNNMFNGLCEHKSEFLRSKVMVIQGRKVTFEKTCGKLLDTSFDELCGRALGVNDYIHVAEAFHTIFIRNVPELSLKNENEAKRFIVLIDILYKNQNRVIISSFKKIEELFSKKKEYPSEDPNALMDDINNDAGASAPDADAFSRHDDILACDKTISILIEMQTEDYWQKGSESIEKKMK